MFKNKIRWIVLSLGILLIGLITWGTRYDAFLYHEPVGQVIKVVNERKSWQTDNFSNKDFEQTQHVTIKLLNTTNKGRTVTISNQFSGAQAMDNEYHVNQQVLLSINKSGDKLVGQIVEIKRDTWVVALILVMILMLVMMQRTGWLSLLSLVINVILFFVAINIDVKLQGNNVLLIFGSLSAVFALIALSLVLGINRKMWISFAATMGGSAAAIIVGLLVFKLTNERGMFFETMEYVTQNPEPLFLAEILMGALGAVMDESTDIIISLDQIITEKPHITTAQLWQSARRIGESIMGPLINVLFMIFMADTFSLMVLYLRNGNNIGYAFYMNMELGMIQTLISGIGIVLVIPIASWLAGRFLTRGENTHD